MYFIKAFIVMIKKLNSMLHLQIWQFSSNLSQFRRGAQKYAFVVNLRQNVKKVQIQYSNLVSNFLILSFQFVNPESRNCIHQNEQQLFYDITLKCSNFHLSSFFDSESIFCIFPKNLSRKIACRVFCFILYNSGKPLKQNWQPFTT